MLRQLSRSAARARAVAPLAAARRQLAVSGSRRLFSSDSDGFMQTTNANYIDEMYDAWKQNPQSVHVSWQAYFRNLDGGVPATQAFQVPPDIVPTSNLKALPRDSPNETLDHLRVQILVRAYQVSGHFRAKVDPLGLAHGSAPNLEIPRQFTIEHYGWTEADLDRKVTLGPGILPRFAEDGKPKTITIRQVIQHLEDTYCKSYGIQYMHIPSTEKCDWIRDRVEIPVPFKFPKEEKRRILDRFMWSSLFESFLATKFPNDKRFGLEGGESLVPGMKQLIDASVDAGVEDIVMGMPHRGRLNVLSNVVRKPNVDIFSEFSGSASFDEGSGDVKYHLGMNYRRPTTNGRHVNLKLAANPSHLEAEDTVVLGQTRAIQHYKDDVANGDKAMAVLLHGDAAVEAQGIVYEAMAACQLPNFKTGGTIHVIINNQIGFTTDPRAGRSTPYPSDFAKTIDAPIFHVNGDDIEAVIFIFNLAAEWRAAWKSDVIIDLICYRKSGHNEIDQPMFTQPLMYKRVAEMVPSLDKYEKKLIDEGTFTAEDVKEHRDWVWSILEEQFKKSHEGDNDQDEKWVSTPWKDFKTVRELRTELLPHLPTAIDASELQEIGLAAAGWPASFEIHRNLKRILEARVKSLKSGEGIDWSTAESIAFGSLLKEGYHVRVSGQDVERGTFSQRHAVLHDQKTGERFTPLKGLAKKPDDFAILNSYLSEYGVLGFEYGYSLEDPHAFVMWEAQFGDFANTAQVIIDQFIAAAESKWSQRSGIVLSLPHGYDGQGPEHSSARIERYLLLCNEDPRKFPTEQALQRQHQDCNIQVVYPTTPANYFHVLRRQMCRQFRKPLIMPFSKALLRHPLARSNVEEFTGESSFQYIIEDPELGRTINDKEGIKRLLLCTGQVWAALHKARAEREIKDIAITRVEQLHPFPWQQLKEAIDSYPNLEEIVWTQEEPLNAGAWMHVYPRLHALLPETRYSTLQPQFVSRNPSASVAAGTKSMHKAEEDALVNEALTRQ